MTTKKAYKNPSLCHSYEFRCKVHSSCHAANLMYVTTDAGSYKSDRSKLHGLSKSARFKRSAGLSRSIRRYRMDADCSLSGKRAGPSVAWEPWNLLRSVRRWRTFWAGSQFSRPSRFLRLSARSHRAGHHLKQELAKEKKKRRNRKEKRIITLLLEGNMKKGVIDAHHGLKCRIWLQNTFISSVAMSRCVFHEPASKAWMQTMNENELSYDQARLDTK